MLKLDIGNPRRILCLGAHADDIEIGCGGTIFKLIKSNPGIEIWWVVFSAEGPRRGEAQASARTWLKGNSKHKVIIKNFRNAFFPAQGAVIKKFFEHLKRKFEPDLVFTHYREDRHQDHRVLSDLAWNTFRDHLILGYEIAKYDGDLGQPNFYVALKDELCRRKAQHLCSLFPSQRDKHWFSADTFLGLMRLRGIECGPVTRYAEAFYTRKLLF